MKFKIHRKDKFIKHFTAISKRYADEECRKMEDEYKLPKYTLKAEAV